MGIRMKMKKMYGALQQLSDKYTPIIMQHNQNGETKYRFLKKIDSHIMRMIHKNLIVSKFLFVVC